MLVSLFREYWLHITSTELHRAVTTVSMEYQYRKSKCNRTLVLLIKIKRLYIKAVVRIQNSLEFESMFLVRTRIQILQNRKFFKAHFKIQIFLFFTSIFKVKTSYTFSFHAFFNLQSEVIKNRDTDENRWSAVVLMNHTFFKLVY